MKIQHKKFKRLLLVSILKFVGTEYRASLFLVGAA